MIAKKLDSLSEDAGYLLSAASKAIESKDPALVFANASDIKRRMVKLDIAAQWDAIMADLDANRAWEAMRKLVGITYTVTPQRLPANLQAALMHLAHVDTDASAAA